MASLLTLQRWPGEFEGPLGQFPTAHLFEIEVGQEEPYLAGVLPQKPPPDDWSGSSAPDGPVPSPSRWRWSGG